MEFLPRIHEGEVRLVISGKRVIHIVEKTPASGNVTSPTFSTNLDSGATHVWQPPDVERHQELVRLFYLTVEDILGRTNVSTPPALWTTDFVLKGYGPDAQYVLIEINAACVGFKSHPGLAVEL